VKLNDPFNGPVFDQMFAEAADTVTSNLLKAMTESDRTKLRASVYAVMLYTLDAVAFHSSKAFTFGTDNDALISLIASQSGVNLNLTETIIGEAYTDSETGAIPAWYNNPAQAVQSLANERTTAEALTPSFAQRVAATIFSPFGIAGSTAITYLKVIAILAVFVGAAYVLRTFKK
jgi:hypothetical protein